MPQDYRETMKNAVLDEETFLRLSLKGAVGGHELAWRRVVVRPVLIRQIRHLQFSYFDARQDITKNYRGDEAQEKLAEVLALPFRSLSLQTTREDVQVQITKEGKAIFSHSTPSSDKQAANLSHDRGKKLPLPADKPDAFLQALGIMDTQGRIIPGMQAKFTQINEFLKLLEHTGELARFEKTPVHLLDCGSGSAYLSFAAYHYLQHVHGLETQLVGVDSNGTLVEKSNVHSQALGFTQACFQHATIIEYVPEVAPDIVLALHACNTATDEALLQGIRGRARLILCAPCCHHELQQQLTAVSPFQPVFAHGILKKRMADILTDTFRALALRIMGYKTDVVEFVSSEHTDRNVLIRAVRRRQAGDPSALRDYQALKNFWAVTPYIERLLSKAALWPQEEGNA